MSRYGFNDEPERENDFNADLPVPTYEEVVGAAANNIGFKENVLLTPTTLPAQRSLAGSSRTSQVESNTVVTEENNVVYCEHRKPSKKKAVFAVTLMIYFVIFGLFIFSIYKKECNNPPYEKSRGSSQITYADYKACEREQWSLEKRLKEIRGSNWELLLRDYENVSKKTENLAREIRSLNWESVQLSVEKTKLKQEILRYATLNSH